MIVFGLSHGLLLQIESDGLSDLWRDDCWLEMMDNNSHQVFELVKAFKSPGLTHKFSL